MAYNGYLFQFGSYVFPMKYIKWDSYKSKPGQRQSLDAYTDGNGVTRDNGLEHSKTEVSFTTLEMGGENWKCIMSNMVKNYINFNTRDAICTYFDFELCAYRTGHFYFDKSFEASANTDKHNKKLKYNEANWMFIEY